MNVYCLVIFEVNYSVGDIRNSDLGEGIICSGEGSGGKGGGKWGKVGREVGVRGEGSGESLPPCPPPLLWLASWFGCYDNRKLSLTYNVKMVKLHFYAPPQRVASVLCHTIRNFEWPSVSPCIHARLGAILGLFWT